MMRRAKLSRGARWAFSLVEVVLAVGIVSTLLVVIVALLGSIMERSADVYDRREAAGAVDALRVYLADEVPFEDVYGWAGSGTKELGYAAFRSDANGEADRGGEFHRGRWGEAASDLADWEDARDGRVFKAILEFDADLSPVSGGALPGLAAFDEAYIVMRASIYPVPTTAQSPTASDRPLVVFPIAVPRS